MFFILRVIGNLKMISTTSGMTAVTRHRDVSSELLKYADANRDEGIFNDVTIQVDNLSIGASRMVLSCYSTFFEKLFKSNMKERYEPIVSITGVDGATVDILINYMYKGFITIDNDSVMSTLAGADYFQMDDVKSYCFDLLGNMISSCNWYSALSAANTYRSDRLRKLVYQFILNQFEAVTLSTDFKTFTKEDLISFFSDLNRSQLDESLIYQALVNWINYKKEERKTDFANLFWHINLKRFSYNALQELFITEPLIQENVDCAKSVLSLLSKMIKEIKSKENESMIIAIGGDDHGSEVNEIFNCHNLAPKIYPDLPSKVSYHRLLKRNEAIFCIGGCCPVTDKVYSNVYQMKLNEEILSWDDVVPLNINRGGIGAAVFDDCLIVAGGFSVDERLASTEFCKDPSDKWKMGPTMLQKRNGHALVVCCGFLYAIGGWNGKERFSSVERLCSLDGKWENVAPMLSCRAGVAAVVLNGFIYAIGGRSANDKTSRLKSVERYDPNNGEWTNVCAMNFVRSGLSACAFQGKIFVIGGVDAEGLLVEKTECYDPSKDEWTIVKLPGQEKVQLHSDVIVV